MGTTDAQKNTVKLWLFVKAVMLKFMFAKMRKTNGEPYTRRLVRTVRGQALGNLLSQDGKAPSAEPTISTRTSIATGHSTACGLAALPKKLSAKDYKTSSRVASTITCIFRPKPVAKLTG